MAVDFTKVPIGTKVETAYGPGVIILGLSPRVTVRVGDVDYPYTCDGRRHDLDARPTLFLAPFQWPEQEQPLPDLAVDTPVMVRSRGWIIPGFAATFADGIRMVNALRSIMDLRAG
jgi:hypothetical protein